MLKFDDLFTSNLGKFIYMETNSLSQVMLPINLLLNNAAHSYNTQLHSQFSRTANAASFLFMRTKLWNMYVFCEMIE